MESKQKKNGKKTIASVRKAIEVIEFIALSEDGVGVTEISNGLNYGVSAIYHLLNTLKDCNIIIQDERTKKFKLGLKLWKIGMLAHGQNPISITLKPYLRKLKELTGETANLTVMDDYQIIYIAQEESDKLVKMFTKPGATAPLHCTSAGKIFLAHQPKKRQNEILDKIEFKKYTNNTIINKDDLKKEMETILKNGYALDKEERELGVSCIGAPIFDFNNDVIACFTISGPTARFTKENKNKWIDIIIDIGTAATNYLKKID